ncbi:hypothetical protein [Blastococcus sp. CT_GayMR16]|uniref:hypothetical protein n=1 Tax=Blastococcus sp. CT_GayMR16 TaxID=2559607 RepID=UPI001ADD89A7|nr:hypothetical protein [Blastococcus sp. CT_GayMR16]
MAVALIATVALALAVGVPTGIIPTPLYTRMTPIQWWNYPGWAATSILGGLVTATYIRRLGDDSARSGAVAATGGGLFGAFAVGCPVCNKLVVATLGASGAMTIWAPLQPVLAVLTVVGLFWVLRRRLTNEYACSVSGSPRPDASAAAGRSREADAESSASEPSSSLTATLEPQRANAAPD